MWLQTHRGTIWIWIWWQCALCQVTSALLGLVYISKSVSLQPQNWHLHTNTEKYWNRIEHGMSNRLCRKDFDTNLALGLILEDLRPFERATSHLDGGQCFLLLICYNGNNILSKWAERAEIATAARKLHTETRYVSWSFITLANFEFWDRLKSPIHLNWLEFIYCCLNVYFQAKTYVNVGRFKKTLHVKVQAFPKVCYSLSDCRLTKVRFRWVCSPYVC